MAATPEPITHGALRLWLARALAWSLLLGGWITLGALGRQHSPTFVAGQLPLAIWLLSIGVALTVAAPRHWGSASLRLALLGAGALAGVALIEAAHANLMLSVGTVAWAVLVVGASYTVRTLRRTLAVAPPSPIGPAIAGALLAWAAAGNLDGVRASAAPIGGALFAVALALAALLPSNAHAHGGCRAGLFDCSLPLLLPSRWRQPADWPMAAAALGMLPMMASLAAMDDWCGAARWPASMGTALHLAAMLLPAALLRHIPLRRPVIVVGALLVLGGLALALPGLTGLMTASLLHGAAWSVAWATMLSAPKRERAPSRSPSPLWPALTTAAAVLLLGSAIDHAGPVALHSVHGALAALGLAGLLARALVPLLRSTRSVESIR